MTTDRWTLKRFPEQLPEGLTSQERAAVSAWLTLLATEPAACGILLPSDHLGTTYPPEHEDYEQGFENLWDGPVPGTDLNCRYQMIAAERTVVCWFFHRVPRGY